MKKIESLAMATLAAACILGQSGQQAFAAETAAAWPSKNITLVVPYPPGGAPDVIARTLKAQWEKAWGKPVIVENKSGGNGVVGSTFVAHAPGDGHTILMGSVATHVINPALFPKLQYKVSEFTPVALIGSTPLILSVSKKIEQKSVAELVAYAKKNPGKLTYASVGNGSAGNLAGELFKLGTGTDIVHVPYRGISQASIDLVGGQVDMTFSNVLNVLPHIQAGKITPLAVTGKTSIPILPSVPTIGSTVKDYEVELWWGLYAPAGTPPEIVRKIHDETNRMLAQAEMKSRFEKEAVTLRPVSTDDFSALMARDSKKWTDVIKAAKITPEMQQ